MADSGAARYFKNRGATKPARSPTAIKSGRIMAIKIVLRLPIAVPQLEGIAEILWPHDRYRHESRMAASGRQ